MYEELKQRIAQVVEAGVSIKANPAAILASIVKIVYADEYVNNTRLAKLCGINRTTLFRNEKDVLHIATMLSATTAMRGATSVVQPATQTVQGATLQGATTEEKEKAEKKGSPQTPLKETRKEKEKSIPPTPQGDGWTDGKPDFVTSGADLVNCEANRCERAPRRQKVVLPADDNDTTPSEDNAMPDHEHYLAFIKAYPPQKAYSFRVKYINKFNKAWRDAIARGYKGKDLVAALEMAKESKKWKETYCDYAPNAIDFLEQNFAALYYPSCKPSKTAAATTVIRADIDI